MFRCRKPSIKKSSFSPFFVSNKNRMAKKLSNQKKKVYAEEYYVIHGLTYEEISERLKVSLPTISKWANEGAKTWKDKRAELITNPHQLRRLLLQEVEKVTNGEDATIDADKLLKLVKAANEVINEVSPSTIYTVLRECDLFINQEDPNLAKTISEAHKRFLLHKIEQED